LTDVSLDYARFILQIVADYAAQGEALKEEKQIGALTRFYVGVASTA